MWTLPTRSERSRGRDRRAARAGRVQRPKAGSRIAKAMGLWGAMVETADELEEGIRAWLSEPGPALLHIKVEPMELVMPPAVEVGPAVGMALYAARAVLQGKGGDVLEMIEENI
ncbi:thiamine pyrophosphate-dependent enzyme [Phenylobacterium sp.]|uniref:thiamine pyrophosphate-dependent enzyme n=1 Tax=Phenylobacterium sp. TaxID=1871053 RepID=UPI00262EFC53|nr:thiamine pyrophosphate-dependent enzyme [Phenylobacterium sp.]